MEFANDFAKKNGVLTINCISQKGIVRRSDAFLFDINGNVVLLDAGLPEVPYAIASLLQLRALYLKGNEKLLENKNCKLKITWIASHIHIDHIGAFLNEIISSPYIYVEKAYLPPRTEYYDEVLSKDWDGDYKYRDTLASRFEEYQKECKIIDVPFSDSKTLEVKYGDASFLILPPTKDWGTPELAAYSKQMYQEEAPRSLPISITNSNSLWLLVSYKGRKLLFTGDSMKKTENGDESYDVMLKNWNAWIKNLDIMKYPHHGMLRDPAAKSIAEMKPKYVLFNAIDATGPDCIRAVDPDIEKVTKFVLTGYQDGIFTIDEGGNLSINSYKGGEIS